MATKLVFLLLLYISNTALSAAVPRNVAPSAFIISSCGATRYPALCIQSLSVYSGKIQQSHRQLAQTALTVSLSHARTCTSFVSKMNKMKGLKKKESQVVKDCLDNMGDSVDQLSKSILELGNMRNGNSASFLWHMSNVQTWVSAALTDESTCVDGFADHALDGKVKAAIRGRVVYVAQVTSNALALVNNFATRRN